MAEPRRPRGIEQLTPEERAQLEKTLDSGVTELPENQVKGVLGEKGLDFGKTDTFEPDLNAGLSQEDDMPVIWLAIAVGYFIFFVPGFVILWLSKRVPIRTKIVASIIMVVGVICFFAFLFTRR